MRRTPLRANPKPRQQRPDRSDEFASWTPSMRKVGVYAPAVACRPAPKEPEPVRDEDYRRLVAALPCALCGVIGASQTAHGNRGKGMGMKTSDLTCFPACHAGANDCHGMWDRYAFGRDRQAAREPELAVRTQLTLIAQAVTDPKTRRILVRVCLITEIMQPMEAQA